jgi:ABC-2 type transport system permease protein
LSLSRLAFVVRIYAKLIATQLRAHLEYRADFWIGIVGVTLTHGAPLVFVWAVFLRVPSVGGWTAWQIALLYGLAILPRGLAELLCDGSWAMRQLVNRGDFDRLLVRPLSPVVQSLTWIASIHGLGSIALGTVVVLRAKAELDLSWAWWEWLFLLFVLAGSVLLIGSVNLASNSVAFWEPSANSQFPYLIGHTSEFVKFPVPIYGKAIQFLVTWVLPFAFISYYPGAVLLGRPSANPWLGYGSPLAGVAVALVAALIWRRGLRRYQSTGN